MTQEETAWLEREYLNWVNEGNLNLSDWESRKVSLIRAFKAGLSKAESLVPEKKQINTWDWVEAWIAGKEAFNDCRSTILEAIKVEKERI